MGKMFGTDGVRGKANVVLTPQIAYELGNKGAYVLNQIHRQGQKKEKILVGRDTRISGTMLESALAAGICASGVDVVLLGVIPTAAVAYLTKKMGAVAGVVISASHNPACDNGIKFFGGNGYKLPDEVEHEIETLILEKREIPQAKGKEVGVITVEQDGGAIYCQHLLEHIHPDLTGMKLVIDGANGAASFLAPEVFAALGAEVVSTHCQPDGWNINLNCGSTHPEQLMERVKQEGADVGLAFDGDADRLLVVDENGRLLSGDEIMVICANDLKQHQQLAENKLVVTVMSNLGLKVAMEAAGVEVLQTKVGDRYVLEEMLKSGAIIGGEQSGHIIFSRVNTTGDGLTTALYFLQVLQESGQKVSQLAQQMTVLPQVMKNVPVQTKDGWDEKANVQAAMAAATQQLAERGRILVRPSGTESLLRVMAEGPDLAELQQVVDAIAREIDLAQNQG